MKKNLSWKEIMIGGLVKGGTAREYKAGDWRDQRPVFHVDDCIQCLLCAEQCPDDAIPVKEQDGKVIREDYNYFFCKGCGVCRYVCPKKDQAIDLHPESEFIA